MTDDDPKPAKLVRKKVDSNSIIFQLEDVVDAILSDNEQPSVSIPVDVKQLDDARAWMEKEITHAAEQIAKQQEILNQLEDVYTRCGGIAEKLLDSATSLNIEIPIGDCFVDATIDSPLILMGASTGITQMKSIIEFLLPRGPTQPIWLYWGVLSAQDLYLTELCLSWEEQYSGFTFVPVVSEPHRSPEWQGRTGLLLDAVLQDFDQLNDMQVYVSGSPGMVYATYDRFIEHGIDAKAIFSDVFAYAPRAQKA